MSIVKRQNVLFPSLMNEILRPDWFGGVDAYKQYTPAVNVKETDNGFELEMVIPGRKKDDIKIEVDKEVLTISSEITKEENETVENYTRKEFSFDSFKRVFTLPETVDAEKINASYEDGILRFVMPKKEEALPKPKRLIELG
jgi:HSP20 family protein